MNIYAVLAKDFETSEGVVSAIAGMLDEGNTIPFIARYRKEQTEAMDDTRLRALEERLTYLRSMEERREKIASAIAEQGKLTPELSAKLAAATTLAQLEDLYLPYRPKRRTRASIAKEKGLEPLAEALLRQGPKDDPEALAAAYVSEENGVPDTETALRMARDILAERFADDADIRAPLRALIRRTGVLQSTLIEEKGAKKAKAAEPEDPDEEDPGAKRGPVRHAAETYLQYADYKEPVLRAANHRILALNRGEKEGLLRVSVAADDAGAQDILARATVRGASPCADQVREAGRDAWERLIEPSLERELRSELTDRANEGAIRVFAENLRELLMQPPVRGRVTLGVDPGFRNGCKLAVVDENGRVLETAIGHFTLPMKDFQRQREEALVSGLIRRNRVTAVAIGNGTASRESEQFIASLLPSLPGVSYMIVNEAGASIWSASEAAAKELPGYDVLERGAISIARRLQDPLAELIKIDPKGIGVGQYQHDLKPAQLSAALSGVVEACVSSVGVDAATASVELLSHVAGIGETLARSIVAFREENGLTSRAQLKKVPKLGPKAFQQCAGFLRVHGKEPLDATAVHPESYAAARALLARMGVSARELSGGGIPGFLARCEAEGMAKLASELDVGEMTLRDIASELERPGRDPRDELPPPLLRTDVMDLSDLAPGMELKGTVRNVTDFGAFVDIGVHQDGLVHISRLADRFIRHPSEAVHVGDIVTVWVVDVDVARKRIGLTMVKGKK
ncbi:MAG: RNA-binding transcriptional accessory protein [Clostridia bacterium]|nr:RNA-binding transcriptional accessory protein [Clostridia bacterium]